MAKFVRIEWTLLLWNLATKSRNASAVSSTDYENGFTCGLRSSAARCDLSGLTQNCERHSILISNRNRCFVFFRVLDYVNSCTGSARFLCPKLEAKKTRFQCSLIP